jgi:hypothetical protein
MTSKNLALFCRTILQWKEMPNDLENGFRQVLHNLKSHDEAAWAEQIAGFPDICEQLQAQYGV